MLRRIKDQRLVIVEDNDVIRDSLTDYFSERNTVRAFSTAEETLAALSRKEPPRNTRRLQSPDVQAAPLLGAPLKEGFQQSSTHSAALPDVS